MKKILFALFFSFVFTNNAYSFESFSHSIIKFPYEYRGEEPWIRVLNSQEDLEAFYYSTVEIYEDSGFELEPMPEIDFEKYTLVVGGLGEQNHGGVELAIGRVDQTSSHVYISAFQINYVGCFTTANVHWPTTGILLNKTSKDISASLTISEKHCEY